MSEEPKAVVNLADLQLHELAPERQESGRYAAQFGEIGRALGFYRLGCMLHVVPPGKSAFGAHRHHGCDEMFFILSGTGEYRIGKDRLPVGPGDCLGAPAGGKHHQIVNTGSEDLKYLGFSNIGDADVVESEEGPTSVIIGTRGNIYTSATYYGRGVLTPQTRREDPERLLREEPGA
ncbi:MAG TPA: cupin domain-containing protein [Caulobacteraceae bacterium]|nr:cupin domain-containing protein [Caulobacteraceae bacterium]